AVARGLELRAAVDSFQNPGRLLSRPALLLRDTIEVLADRAEGAIDELLLYVDQLHVEAAGGERLGDAVAHRAATDDRDATDGRRRPSRHGFRRGAHPTRSTAI